MGAVTPSATKTYNLGSLNLTIATFANTTDSGDTWDSNIPDIVKVWANQTDAATTQAAIGCGATNSSDSITIYLGADDSAVDVFVLHGGGY